MQYIRRGECLLHPQTEDTSGGEDQLTVDAGCHGAYSLLRCWTCVETDSDLRSIKYSLTLYVAYTYKFVYNISERLCVCVCVCVCLSVCLSEKERDREGERESGGAALRSRCSYSATDRKT